MDQNENDWLRLADKKCSKIRNYKNCFLDIRGKNCVTKS